MSARPMQGTWTLIAPDGRKWQASHPLKCVAAEQRERIPAEVALKRMEEILGESDLSERHLDLGRFYNVTSVDGLIDQQSEHILRLQEKLREVSPSQPMAGLQRVREG